MTIKDKRIGVLMGGMSSERDISLKSGKAVLSALQSKGFNAIGIDVDPDLPSRLRMEKIDIAWIALHGAYGEDGCVQGLLEIMQIPYTGSSVRACANSMDKIATKTILRNAPVTLISDQIIKSGDNLDEIKLPAVVKDPIGGSSIGVWICHERHELNEAVSQCGSEEILVESFVSGEEITVAVLDGKALPAISIRPKAEFFDLKAKYTKGMTEYIVPSPLPTPILENAQQQACAAYKSLEMSGIARADFIVPSSGTPQFLEINASPGMTSTSLCPMAANCLGINFEELIVSILETAKLNNIRMK